MATLDELHFLAYRAVHLYGDLLFRDSNVNGVGVGRKKVKSADSGEPCVTIFVSRKFSRGALSPSAWLPEVLDVGGGQTIRTDVIEAGPFYQHANTARIRPAQPGTSIGVVTITAGTFGGVVVDNSSGDQLILSNNHVLANNNQSPIGASIVQPGRLDGGTAPADTIASLLRYIYLSTTNPNLVDAAVALPTTPGMISNVPLNGVPAPSPTSPAVGLIFSGDGVTVSNLNPIQTVLTTLEVNFPEPSSVIPATIGMSVQKTGRTTEKTTGTVQTVNTTVRVNYPIGLLTFSDQITTSKISEGGDSGSIVVLN